MVVQKAYGKQPVRLGYYFSTVKVTATKQKWTGSQGKEQVESTWSEARKRLP